MFRLPVILGFLVVSACSLPISPECERYVACQKFYDEEFNRTETRTNAFAADGTCWESETLADECTANCVLRTTNNQRVLSEAQRPTGPCVVPGG